MLERFNVLVDLKNMSSLSRFDALQNSKKNLICSNCFLSTTSDKKRLSSYEEELMVKRDTLLLVKPSCNDEFVFSIKEFVRRYGVKNLAIDIRNIPRYKQNIISEKLLKEGFSFECVSRLLYKNADQFFSLFLMQ